VKRRSAATQRMLDRFRSATKCSWCGKPTPQGCDPAHVFHRGMGGSLKMDHPWLLVSLCRACHAQSHWGHRPTQMDLLAIAAAREGVLQDDIRELCYRLRGKRA